MKFNLTRKAYLHNLLLALVGRGLDFLSTWMASPSLTVEANVLAKKVGWVGMIIMSAVVCVVAGFHRVAAVGLGVFSALLAADNFRNLWLIRNMGEDGYMAMIGGAASQASIGTVLISLGARLVIYVGVGTFLYLFTLRHRSSDGRPHMFDGPHQDITGIGLALIVYGVVTFVHPLVLIFNLRG